MDYTWPLQISQTYALRSIYQDAQSATVEAHGRVDAPGDCAALLGRIRALKSLGQSLEDDYADIL